MELKASEMPSVAALSFLGDAVHTLAVRRYFVEQGLLRSGELNDAARPYVSAEGQAKAAACILPHLTERESDLFRRAYNSSHLNRPRHASGRDYRAATGFEAVLGLLSYEGKDERLSELLSLALRQIKGDEKHDSEN